MRGGNMVKVSVNMKFGLFLLAILVVLCGLSSVKTVYAFDDSNSKSMCSLEQFDGTKKDIKGFLGYGVEKAFFSKDSSEYLKSGDMYCSVFKVDNVKKLKKMAVVLSNSLEDGRPYPIVISLVLPPKKFKNYIVEFGKDSKKIIDFRNELQNIDLSIQRDSYLFESDNEKKNYEIEVRIIGSSPFTCEYSKETSDKSSNENVTVIEPANAKQEDRFTASLDINDQHNRCCLDTFGEKRRVRSINRIGQESIGWIKVVRFNCDYRFCTINMTAYYPTMNDILHRPDSSYDVMQRCYFQVPSGTQYNYNCYNGPDVYALFTLCGYGANTQTLQWEQMGNAIFSSSYPAKAKVIKGPSKGETWQIWYDGY